MLRQELPQSHRRQSAAQEMIIGCAKELRTPLTSIRALVDTLIDGAIDEPAAARRFLHHMTSEVDAMNRIIQDLLDLGRFEAAKDQFQVAALSPTDLLWRAAERARAEAERAQVTLHLVTPPNLPTVYVDGERIQQVLRHLLQNALKFTPPSGTIKLAATNGPVMVTISITDTGVGIAEEDLPWIFEWFYQNHRSRPSNGTGLGLAMAKHIVQAHGGEIWVESQLEEGAAFFFTLPTTQTMQTDIS